MTLSFATISKYPPYISGHAHQAYWLNRELAHLLQREQHQVSYCGPVPPWYRDPGVVVHEVAASADANPKVPDGQLLKALAARLAGLVHDGGVSALLALYADPHAEVALRAARTARLVGDRVTVAVSVEGSDITSSLARHTGDGEAMVLLSDIAAADVVMAVSHRAGQLLAATAETVLGAAAADDLAARVVVRYPGLPSESFRPAHADRAQQWRASLGIEADQRLVSTFVRLVPEKGVERILQIAEAARGRTDLVFAIAGTGPLDDSIRAELKRRGLTQVRMVGDLSQPQAHLLRTSSDVALLPSLRTPEWEETFGIAALEYQALGVPVIASDSPGFAESCAVPEFRLSAHASAQTWLSRVDSILAQPRLRGAATDFAAGFTSRRSAEQLLEAVQAATIDQFAAAR
jgi:glycosyltransferase involved in cell wall biosynthesis